MKSLLSIMLWMATAGLAGAVSPVIWKQNTQEAFGKGEASSVSITRDGEVRLGPSLVPFADTEEEFVWALVRDRQTVYAGTGSEGRVYRLGGGTADLVFDSPERAIFSLAVDGNGTVYAGSSPGGLIYAIPKKGEPRTFARTEDEHVWVLISDGGSGLYAATGGRVGRVLHISSSGEVKEVLKTSDPNVSSLIRTSDGSLYAGTDENGLIYRVDPAGSVDVLYDTSEDEVSALAMMADGRLVAGAMNSSAPSPQRGAAAQNGGKSSGGQSAIYIVRPSGSGWRLWDVPNASIHELSISNDGAITILTGGDGHIFRLYADGSHSVVTQVKTAQPWVMVDDGKGGGYIGMSGTGEVLALGSSVAKSGSLTSEPEDFSLMTSWGRIRWEGDAITSGKVSFETRVGNSELPDETWGNWTPVGTDGELTVKPGRYIQYRLNLSGDGKDSPSVREVALSGLPENIQPLILDLKVLGPHEAEAAGGQREGKNGGRSAKGDDSESGWTISWTGTDINNDVLSYSLHFKGRSDKTWKLLEEDISGNSYLWETDAAPEGTTLVRLTVSDLQSNPAQLAQSYERISAPFDIDHTEPTVSISAINPKGNGQVEVSGTITDATTYIASAAYALNSGEWHVLFPSDDVFDSGNETIGMTVEGLVPGEYTIVIRATDGRGNVGVAKRLFDVK